MSKFRFKKVFNESYLIIISNWFIFIIIFLYYQNNNYTIDIIEHEFFILIFKNFKNCQDPIFNLCLVQKLMEKNFIFKIKKKEKFFLNLQKLLQKMIKIHI